MFYGLRTDHIPIEHLYDIPASRAYPLAPIVMFLGIVLNVISHVARDVPDFVLQTVAIIVRLSFETTPTPMTAVQQDVLDQLPPNLHSALRRFNLSARTITFAACPVCHALYRPTTPSVPGVSIYPNSCSSRPHPDSQVCDTVLLDDKTRKPVRPYVVQDFKDYSSGLLSQSENVRFINASCDDAMESIRQGKPAPDQVGGPLQGEFIKSFMIGDEQKEYFVDRGDEIRLPFAFHTDSFNVEGMSIRGASRSCTILSAACLALPPELRYKSENVYLAAIIPGPTEPHLTQMNHYIAPVIDMSVDAWVNGIHHSRTALHPQGCTSRSAVVVAVMDLVAARKTSQLASHSSHFFCHVCNCYHQSERSRCDFQNWTRHDVDERARGKMARRIQSQGTGEAFQGTWGEVVRALASSVLGPYPEIGSGPYALHL